MYSQETLEKLASAALKGVSRNQAYKSYVLRDPVLHSVLLRGVSRYIGGETQRECLLRSEELHQQGFRTILDFMGESIGDAAPVERVMLEFEQLIDAVAASPSGRAISPDLSHIGLGLDLDFALQNAARLAKRAKAMSVEIMLNMEESTRTAEILEIHRCLCRQFDNVGITLQAYLHRTEKDLVEALERPGRVRLVKGAYQESDSVALPLGPQVDSAYANFAKTILDRDHPCYLATHDPALLNRAHELLWQNPKPEKDVEFEMNFGIRADCAARMRDLGYPVRIYLPYGKEWFLYLCHRIAEHPPNLYQALIDVIEGGPRDLPSQEVS